MAARLFRVQQRSRVRSLRRVKLFGLAKERQDSFGLAAGDHCAESVAAVSKKQLALKAKHMQLTRTMLTMSSEREFMADTTALQRMPKIPPLPTV